MFRFTIRDVLWLTVMVALVIGWGVDHARVSRSRDRAIHERDAAISDAEKLAYYWDWFLPQIQQKGYARDLDEGPAHYVQWEQFKKFRTRYETLQRPSLVDE